jgi:hypothetical protein
MLPAAEKIVLVLEGIGDDKIRVNSSSLDHPLTILPDQTIEIVAIEKKVMVGAGDALGLLARGHYEPARTSTRAVPTQRVKKASKAGD